MGAKVGIDVAKATLEVAVHGVEGTHRFANDEAGRKKLVRWLRSIEAELVVLEATGGYERAVLDAVHAGGIAIARAHASAVHAFHRAVAGRAKTDPIDARVIAHFAATVEVKRYVPRSAAAAELDELVRLRESLVETATGIQCQLKQVRSSKARRALEAALKTIDKAARTLAGEFDALIEADAELKTKAERVRLVGGFRTINTATILSALPELGTASRTEIAALAGVAPISRDSGTKRGVRRIGGGRPRARRPLYLAAITLVRRSAPFRDRFLSLVARGKPKKVALTALMRKLVVLLNAVVRDGVVNAPPVGA